MPLTLMQTTLNPDGTVTVTFTPDKLGNTSSTGKTQVHASGQQKVEWSGRTLVVAVNAYVKK